MRSDNLAEQSQYRIFPVHEVFLGRMALAQGLGTKKGVKPDQMWLRGIVVDDYMQDFQNLLARQGGATAQSQSGCDDLLVTPVTLIQQRDACNAGESIYS